MQHDRHSLHAGPRRGAGRFLFWLAAALIAAAIAVKWAWNGAGATLFSLPAASFGEIVAIVAAVVAVLVLVRLVLRGPRRNHGE